MALLKLCRCGKQIPLGTTMCEECMQQHMINTKARHREYKWRRKDKEAQALYSSKRWKVVRDKVKARDNGLCKLCYSDNKIRYMDTVHHIITVEECKSLILEPSNLICLCEKCHQRVHNAYKASMKDRIGMQQKLKTLVHEGL